MCEAIVAPMFEVVLTKRGRTRWEWQVRDRTGSVIMGGVEDGRSAAKYQGERALFLLLSAAPRQREDPPQPRWDPKS
jgi:hypothetical protein